MPDHKDITPPELIKDRGSLHPINHMKDSIMELLTSFGFEIIDGPEIETEEFNFDMLNIKKSHPARQMHDTFYVENKSNLLRTHTSPVQIRGMLEKKPPLAFISGGKVYRKDDDATHLPMFHQVEGIYVDENVSFAQLKDLIYKIIYSLFGEGVELRLDPHTFHSQNLQLKLIYYQKRVNGLKYLGAD
jgi:phenylalanyl-tRNA synthetase alpha chain